MKKRGKIGLGVAGVILSLIIFSFYFVSVSGSDNWIIEGDKVYVDNSNVYISAEPHTIHENGYVYFNLTSKVYTGNIDLVLGFDTAKIKPVKAELYEPEWVEQAGSYTCNFNNSYFNYTLSPNYFWCYTNKTAAGNETGLTLIYERDFEWLVEKIAYWNETYLEEWKDISQAFSSINYEHGGMNKWYHKKNIPIIANQNYQFRVLMNMDRNGFSPEPVDTKYWFAIKPSGETLQQAITNNHFYVLDPWVNSSGANQNKDYLTIGLRRYYKFDETSGTTASDTFLGQNITVGNSTGWISGLINNSYYGNHSEKINTTYKNADNGGNITINLWIKRTGQWQNSRYIFDTSQIQFANGAFTIHTGVDATVNTIRFGTYGTSWGYTSLDSPVLTQDVWQMFTFHINSSSATMYMNGTYITNRVGLGFIASNIAPFFLGGYNSSASITNTIVDELGIWNRTLNDTEVVDLFNNGAGITYSPTLPDITPPNVTIDSPLNQTYLTRIIEFNLTVLDESAISTCLYSLDGGANITMSNNTASHFYHINLSVTKGSHTAYFYCNDTHNNINNTEKVTFSVLNTPPNQSQPMLRSPSGKNLSTEDLTCYNQSTYDADNDVVTNIYNWYKNSQPLAVLNLPFEINADDYSNNNNHGTIYGASFIDGKVGNALNFDGVDDYIFIPDSSSLDFTNKKSWEIWFKRVSFNTLQMLFDKTNGGTNYRLALRPDNKLEFSYFIPPAPTSFVWVTNTKNEFDLGIYNQTKWNGTAVTLNSTSVEQQIFFDGFESGTFSTYGWTVSGPGTPWIVSNETPYEGIYHARAKQTGAGTETILETNVSTAGFYNINFSFYVQRVGLDAADDFTVYYFNGTNWKTLESSAGSPADDSTYIPKSYILSDEANNNSNLKIRFRCTAGAVSEYCRVDNVKVKGIGSAFYNNGNYTSKIFDAEGISEWKNLSWTKTLPVDTNLTFQIRSCNDFVCFGEIFVGPDNTTNTYFTNSEFNDISFIADNKYFQYKAYFSTTDIKKSAGLYSVSVNYIRNVTDGLINLVSNSAINDTNWHYIVITFDNSVLTSNFNLYLDSILETTKTEHNLPVAFNNNLYMGKRYPENDSFFNGIIDEVKIYNEALTQEQISAHYNLEYNKVVNQETTAGDNWMCQITPNDAEDDGITKNSSTAEIFWAITFDVRDSYSNVSLNGVTISCNYTGFNQAPYTTNLYGPYGFPPGNWQCNFATEGYYGKTIIFIADNDTTINVKLSAEKQLTVEEHTWLEAIYNCLYQGDCSLYNLLLEINQTVGNIWEHTKPTDESVVTFENITNKVVNSTNNLTIEYTISIPIKAGYVTGTYLPVRIGYWFLDENNETCYNQGDKPTGVEDPYCQPLVIETIGPMGGSISFTVKMKPSLPAGNYNIKRIIDIDPQGTWTNYGQEAIGVFTMLETLTNSGIGLEKTGETMPGSGSTPSISGGSGGGGSPVTNVYNTYVTKTGEGEKEQGETEVSKEEVSGSSWITGGVIGANLLSGGSIVIIVAILCGTFIVFMIVRYKTRIRLKNK